ncbi:unnamed protein product, partial [Rotaria sp. Silwood1]
MNTSLARGVDTTPYEIVFGQKPRLGFDLWKSIDEQGIINEEDLPPAILEQLMEDKTSMSTTYDVSNTDAVNQQHSISSTIPKPDASTADSMSESAASSGIINDVCTQAVDSTDSSNEETDDITQHTNEVASDDITSANSAHLVIRRRATEKYLSKANKRIKVYYEFIEEFSSGCSIGDFVGINIDKVDRTNTDPKILPVVVFKKRHDKIKVACEYGIIDTWWSFDSVVKLSAVPEKLINLNTSQLKKISIITASKLYVRGSANGFTCSCKGSCKTKENNPIIIGQNNSHIRNVIKLFADTFAESLIEVNSVIGQRMMLTLQQIQTANINLPSTSTSLLQNIFPTHIVLPRLAPTVDQVYQNNDLINQSLQLVPYILLSERSLQILKKCDKANDTKNDIIQHIIERIQVIEITVDENRLKYYSTDGISYKSSDDTYILQINKELFEDCINAFNQPMVLNKAKLRLVISICHEFIHHKMHKYLLNDKWSKAKYEKTPPELVESDVHWEKHVIGGRVIKINKTIYSFITNNGEKIDLEDDLCAFLLDKVNYDDENSNA